MISRDDAYAWGIRFGLHYLPVTACVAVGSFFAAAALGWFAERLQIFLAAP